MKNNSRKRLNVTPLFYAIGNASEDIYWAYKRVLLEGGKVNIIAPYLWTQILQYKICNKELFNLVTSLDNKVGACENLSIAVLRFYVNIIFVIKRSIGIIYRNLFKKGLSDSWYFPEVGKKDIWPPLINGNIDRLASDPILDIIHDKTEIHIRENIKQECFNALREYEIDLERHKFVCLHVRDNGYYQDYNRRSYRNATIDNYHEAINFLVENGLFVFRLGDTNMSRLGLDTEKVIDYPFTKLKSDAMDLFLISKCEFYIGMQSGPYDVANIFNRPMLVLNMYSWFYGYPLKVCDRGLMKKIIMPDGSEVKTFKQIINLPYFFTDYTSESKEKGGLYVENNSREILSAVKEFYKDYQSGFTRNISSSMMSNYLLYRDSNEAIINDLSHPFYGKKHNPNLITRNILYNLSAKGALYEF
jgi:putative glycosyltransferase (TIGR04372 family)